MMALLNDELQETATSSILGTLKVALKNSQWAAGAKLPSERALAEQFGFHRMSVRQALLTLENEGLLFRIDRKGWFVAQKRFIYDVLNYVSFQKSASDQGLADWTDTSQEMIKANANEAKQFKINEDDPVFRIHGWGAFNKHPIFVHDMLINCISAPDYPDHFEGQSFTQIWQEHYNITPVLDDLIVRPIRLSEGPRQVLGCSSSAPGLYIRRIKSDGKGNIIQIDREFWRVDAIELHFSTAVK